jgi:hypothetical protein
LPQDVIGKRISPGAVPTADGDSAWFTIVGVAAAVHDQALHEEPRVLVYYPLLVTLDGSHDGMPPPRQLGYAVRARSGDPAALAPVLRSAIAETDPNLPLADLSTNGVPTSRPTANI